MKLLKNKVFAISASAIAATALFSAGALAGTTLEKITAYKDSGVTFTVDGQAWSPKDANGKPLTAITYNNSYYVPLRAGFEKAGYGVTFDSAAKKVALTSPSGTATSTPADQSETAGNDSVSLDQFIIAYNGSITSLGLSSDLQMTKENVTLQQTTATLNVYNFTYLEAGGTSPATVNLNILISSKTHNIQQVLGTLEGSFSKGVVESLISGALNDKSAGQTAMDKYKIADAMDKKIPYDNKLSVTEHDKVIDYYYMTNPTNAHCISIYNTAASKG